MTDREERRQELHAKLRRLRKEAEEKSQLVAAAESTDGKVLLEAIAAEQQRLLDSWAGVKLQDFEEWQGTMLGLERAARLPLQALERVKRLRNTDIPQCEREIEALGQ